ncbi:MAG: tRNA (guanosine(46)-N7)-methyltransferase TrmB [Spirosomataceae bacterium]
MSRRKLHRFAHNEMSPLVVERGKEWYTTIKGKWKPDFFKNEHPLVLELACGKGEYTVGLGQVFPSKNFIGIDIKGDRIARGSARALEMGLQNVAFLRTGIQFLEEFFEEDEVDEIWLVHPDPQPRDKEEKRRLSNAHFLGLYEKILKSGSIFHLKTDSAFLYEYTLQVLKTLPQWEVEIQTDNLYESPVYADHFSIRTYYEDYFVKRGHQIHYIRCRLRK